MRDFFRKLNVFGYNQDDGTGTGATRPVGRYAAALVLIALLGGLGIGQYVLVPKATEAAVESATEGMVTQAAATAAQDKAVETAKAEAVKGMMLSTDCTPANANNCGQFVTAALTTENCKKVEGLMLSEDCTAVDADSCAEVEGMMKSADCKAPAADTCAEVEGVMLKTDCKAADAETCGDFVTAPVCAAKFPQTTTPPVVTPPVAGNAGNVVQVTFTGKPDGTMDWSCPSCPAGTQASGSPQGIVLALAADKKVTCPNPPRLAAGAIFTADCQ